MQQQSQRFFLTLEEVLSGRGQLGEALQRVLGQQIEAPGKGGQVLRALGGSQHGVALLVGRQQQGLRAVHQEVCLLHCTSVQHKQG